MQKENLKLIKLIKQGSTSKLLELYEQNFRFILYYSRILHVTQQDLEDYKQLCYLALTDAVIHYKEDCNYSFITCYSKYILNYYTRNCLASKYIMKIPIHYYRNHKNTEELCYLQNPLEINNFTESIKTSSSEDASLLLFKELQTTLWSLVDSILDETNARVIKNRYINNMTLQEIGNLLGIGKERVRQREIRSLNKLRQNKMIQELAKNYYYISTTS